MRFPVQVTVYDERSEPYMTALQNLTALSGDRTEILAASYQARVLLNQLFHMQGSEARDIRLESIQDYEDGVKPLPLSKASAGTTAKMLIAAPQMTHVEWAAGFFYNTLKDASISPDERALAFMGLAALKEPVLFDIRRIVNSGDLTTAQKLYFATGLAELGDFEYAQKVYETLAGTIITDGNQKYIAGNDADEQLQNTTAALMLTSILHHPDADMLMRWLNSPEAIPEGTRPYMHTNPYTLEVLTYAQNYTMPQADDAARFAYASSDGEREYTLDEDGRKTLLFDAQTLHTANLKTVSGDLMAGVYYTGNAAQDTRTDKGLVKITKTYTPAAGSLETNQAVRVDLKITFDPQVPSGCYNVTDYIPSGMRYMERNSAYTEGPRERWIWSYLDCEGQQISARVYRDLEIRKNTGKEELRNDGYTESEIDDYFNQNEYTLTYNVSTVLPGEFITESTYITEETNAISAHSERGEVQITLTDPSISDQ